MKKLTVSFCLLLITTLSFAQSHWIKKEIGNNITVAFPSTPVYKLNGKTGIYSSKSENNLFLVAVQYDAIPNYSEFVKLSKSERDGLIELLLDNTIKGVLTQSGNEGASFGSIQKGGLKGRETYYSVINPATGERAKKYCRIYFAFNKILCFQCMSLTEERTINSERETFLNSITIN